MKEAVSAILAKNFPQAKLILQKILSNNPRSAEAHTLAGVIADQENDLRLAEKHFAAAARLKPNEPGIRNNYGAILVRLNRKEEAAREFAASLKINPNQSSALVNLAQIRFNENDLQVSRQLFEKAKAIKPDAEITRALIVIALRLNEKELVAKDYREYAELLEQTPTENAIAQTASRIELGKALLDGGFIDEAIHELEAITRISPENADAFVSLSHAYLKRKDIKSAGRLLESAVSRGIDDAKIYAALAEVYETGGFYENAIPAMRLAIRKDTKNEFYRARYGLLLIDAKAPAAAVIRLNEALKEFPNSARLWLALGIANLNDNKSAEARAAFERALSINPKLVPALAYLATTFVDQGRNDEAVKIFERGILLDEKNAVLHYLLADTLLKTANPNLTRVESALKRAVELDPDLASAHSALGRLYARQERWAEAAASLELATKLEPKSAETLYQLGRVYARLKRTNESRSVLAKFKELSDTQKEQKEADRKDLVRRLANVSF
ncbi:MAG: tetratricopeptide repeat protein [Acidobacteriota bacterium]|nr:tetratricopeptide repeat protein [Acidobacteriota bacterium]